MHLIFWFFVAAIALMLLWILGAFLRNKFVTERALRECLGPGVPTCSLDEARACGKKHGREFEVQVEWMARRLKKKGYGRDE